jgi:hypothetical protein
LSPKALALAKRLIDVELLFRNEFGIALIKDGCYYIVVPAAFYEGPELNLFGKKFLSNKLGYVESLCQIKERLTELRAK